MISEDYEVSAVSTGAIAVDCFLVTVECLCGRFCGMS
jgi:hypothetical protein